MHGHSHAQPSVRRRQPGEHGQLEHRAQGRADRRWLLLSLAVIVCFMAGEVVVGLLAGSLALLADAGHMLTDAAALGLAVLASKVAERPARGAYTFGFTRVDALSAQINGLSLLGLSVWFMIEGIRRLLDPPEVPGAAVLVVALIGIVVNLIAAALAGRAGRDSLNVRGAIVHVVNDLWAFLATAVAGLAMLLFGWFWADAVATLVVAVLMIRAGTGLVTAAGRVFLEAAPEGVDPRQIGSDMAAVAGVAEVHDLHVWDLGSGEPALSAHLVVAFTSDCHAVSATVRAMLQEHHHIEHATLQADHRRAGSELLEDDCSLSHGPGYVGVINAVERALDVGAPQRGVHPGTAE
jgi:cobalt-zinc-cadmium efflux system protein